MGKNGRIFSTGQSPQRAVVPVEEEEEINVFPCTSWRHIRRMEVYFHSFLISAVDGYK
jgi:hypothetical protein